MDLRMPWLFKRTTAKQYRYSVLVDDNFHYTDESQRYSHGTYGSLDAAIAACKAIVDDFLASGDTQGPRTAKERYESYVACGPDPFIVTDDPAATARAFSAWNYAREQCFRLAGEVEEPQAGHS